MGDSVIIYVHKWQASQRPNVDPVEGGWPGVTCPGMVGRPGQEGWAD